MQFSSIPACRPDDPAQRKIWFTGGMKLACQKVGVDTMSLKFLPLAEIAATDSVGAQPQYGWESVGLALLLALGLVGGLMLTQVLYRWLVRQITRSGSDPEHRKLRGTSSLETNGSQEC
jgi:hypothetical protein